MRFLKSITICGLLFFVSCGRIDEKDEWLRKYATDAKLRNPADVARVVAHAAQSDRAVIFVNVDWNMDMQFATPKFAKLADTYCSKHGLPPVGFYYIDCTSISDDYGPLRELAGWQDLEDRNDRSLLGGRGEVVWLEHGRVLKIEPLQLGASPGDLLTETLETFRIRT